MELPTKKVPAKTDPTDYSIFLYGPTKIGKTTFAADAPDMLILACEPGCNALDCYQQPIGSWVEFTQALGLLAAGDHQFKSVCIDTVERAYAMCLDHICAEMGIKGPEERKPADVYGPINREFKRVFTKLANLPIGLLCIAHAKEVEIKTRTGAYDKTVPALSNTPGQFLEGLVDMVLLAQMDTTTEDGKTTEMRIIRTKPSLYYSAGDRTGRLPAVLEFSYQAFEAAFSAATATDNSNEGDD
jgi:hypothetical protein